MRTLGYFKGFYADGLYVSAFLCVLIGALDVLLLNGDFYFR